MINKESNSPEVKAKPYFDSCMGILSSVQLCFKDNPQNQLMHYVVKWVNLYLLKYYLIGLFPIIFALSQIVAVV